MATLFHLLISIVEIAWISASLALAIVILNPPLTTSQSIIGTALIMTSVEMTINRCRRLTQTNDPSKKQEVSRG